MMTTAHDLIADYGSKHRIDWQAFCVYRNDAGYSEEECNMHDSRFLAMLETYVEQRDAGAV